MSLPRLGRSLPALSLTALIVVLGGCGGGGGGGGGGNGGGSGGGVPTACGESARKQFVLSAAREWYLFDDLLPASVNTADFASAEALLDHLTATARQQGKDRYYSYLTTQAAENSLLGEGQFIGFGFRNRTDPGNRPMVLDVFEQSPASDAAMLRGDEIVAVDSGSGYVPVSQLLVNGTTFSDVLGPAEVGVRRGLRLLRNGVTRDVTLVKRTVTIDPVPDTYGTQVLPQAGTAGVGYLSLRSYISTADPQLTAAFEQFRALGIRDYIIDLRYNGGGLLSIAELFNNLLGGARAASDVQYRLTHNARKSAENETALFSPKPQSVQPVRVAFLTTGATASASEINVNSMAPWLEVAIVGEDTLGKPVGQYAFDLQGCEDRLRLVSFKTVNALGQGDYYDGLASTMKFACAASDTIAEPLGSPNEGMVAAALAWLSTGACAQVMATKTARTKTSRFDATDPYPLPTRPTPAQWWLPGVN
jgi:C-terminal processing protease CtpA/Prc